MKAIYNIPYGLYILSTAYSKYNACVINTAQQVTSSPNRISIAVNKNNFTCTEIQKSKVFNISILNTEADFELIKRFGFCSGVDTNKFDGFEGNFQIAENGVPYVTKNVNSYICASVCMEYDLGTHILFIADVTDDVILNELETMSYSYYQANVKPKIKPKKTCYICSVCGYVYEGETLPDDFICPICKHDKSVFEKTSGVASENNNQKTIKGENSMSKKYVCPVCGYVYEGENPPEICPLCGAKMKEADGEKTWAAEHVVGVAKDTPAEIIEGLRMNFNGECSEVGMYLAMSRVAFREGYPEIGMYYEKAAYEEADHAARFAEMLGEVVTDSTKKNLELRVEAEYSATAGKVELAKKAKELGLDAIHDSVHEMSRDEARHGRAFEGLLKRYFKD